MMSEWGTYSEFLNWSEAAIEGFFAILLRVSAVVALLPGIGERVIPNLLKVAFVVVLTLVIYPTVEGRVSDTTFNSAGAFVSEAISGLILGAVLRLFLISLQFAGTVIAQASSLSQLFDSVSAEPQPAMGHLILLAGLAILFQSNFHLHVVEHLVRSYDIFLPGRLQPANDALQYGLWHIGYIFAFGFNLAMPFLIISFVYNLLLGVVNRAMPQLMISLIGAPALILGSIALGYITIPVMLGAWIAVLIRYLNNPFAPLP